MTDEQYENILSEIRKLTERLELIENKLIDSLIDMSVKVEPEKPDEVIWTKDN